MIIEFENGLLYDTSLSFENQETVVITYINEVMTAVSPVLVFDDSYRVTEYVYMADSKTEIVKMQEFANPAPDCELKSSYIMVRGIEIWHDKSKAIQIILTFQQQIDLLTAYPKFAVYTSESNLPTFIEGNLLYTYDNTLCVEYRMLVMYFGGIINDKNNNKDIR